mgnify:CR=1 FL=1
MGQMKTKCSSSATGLFFLLLMIVSFSSCTRTQKDIIHSAEYAPGKNAANVTCPAASIFCHTVNYRSDRRGICYHHSCGTA